MSLPKELNIAEGRALPIKGCKEHSDCDSVSSCVADGARTVCHEGNCISMSRMTICRRGLFLIMLHENLIIIEFSCKVQVSSVHENYLFSSSINILMVSFHLHQSMPNCVDDGAEAHCGVDYCASQPRLTIFRRGFFFKMFHENHAIFMSENDRHEN